MGTLIRSLPEAMYLSLYPADGEIPESEDSCGYGNGYGYGNGDGYGNGFGWGDGSGDGAKSDYGDGYGDGSGSPYGSGYNSTDQITANNLELFASSERPLAYVMRCTPKAVQQWETGPWAP